MEDSAEIKMPQAHTDFVNTKMSMSAQFGIKSAFVRVAELAIMMGIPANSIHALMRQGRFPIAHRRVGRAVVVKFDDFVGWYCSADTCPAIADVHPVTVPQPMRVEALTDVLNEPILEVPVPASFQETSKERAARFKREAHEALRRRGLVP